MARIPTIVARQSPLAGAPQSEASGADFGADIGRAVQGLGSTITQIGGAVEQIGAQRQADADRTAVATAVANTSFVEPYNETVTNYPEPDGKNLVPTVSDGYDAFMESKLAEFAKTGASKKAQDAYRLQLLADKPLWTGKAAIEATDMANVNSKVLAESGVATIVNDVRTGGMTTFADFQVQYDKGVKLIDSLPNYTPQQRVAGKRQLQTSLASARFQALADAQTTLPGIADVAEQLAAPEWKDKFGEVEYGQMVRYIETAKTSISTEARAIAEGTLSGLEARAGKVLIPASEMTAAGQTLANLGTPLTAAQWAKWEAIQIGNNALLEAQGLTAADVETSRTGGVNGPARISYTNQHAIRNRPVMPALANIYTQAANAAGVDEIRVVSGGQAKIGSGGKRTGSIRHDEGGAGDIQLIKDGRVLRIDNPADLPIIINFLRSAYQLGAGGIGAGVAYMGSSTFHVGFGPPGIWGKDGKRANAPAWLVEALEGVPAGTPADVTWDTYRGAIAQIETGGQATPYSHVTPSGALGKYGIMRGNIAEWSKAALGKSISEAEFLASPELQDKIFDHRFGMYVKKYGPTRAAAAWFAGEGGMGNNRAMDILGTDVQEYMAKFDQLVSGGGAGVYTGPTDYPGGVTGPEYTRQVVIDAFKQRQETGLNGGVIDYIQTPDGGSLQISPLSLTSTGDDWKARNDLFNVQKDKYDLAPNQMKPLTANEVAVLSELMDSNDAAKQLQVLSAITGGFDQQNQEYAFKQLGDVDPVFAQAGRALADGHGDTALAMLEGRKLTKTEDGLETTWQKDANEKYLELTGNGNVFAGIDTRIRAGMKGAVDAVYAYNTRMGNGEFDEVAYERAIEQVTGMNLDEVNGVKTLLPSDLDADTVHTAMSVMDIETWVEISEDKLPPIGKAGPIETWQLEGAILFVVDDEGFYDVYVDGGKVMTEANRPFRVQLVGDVIRQIAAEGVAAAREAMTGTNVLPTINPVGPSEGSPLLPGMETLAPITPPPEEVPPNEARNKDDRVIPPPPTVPPAPVDDAMTIQSGAVWMETIRVYRDAMEDAGLDEATVDRLVKEFDAKQRPAFIKRQQSKYKTGGSF